MKDFALSVSALERCLEVSKPQESTIRKVYAMLAGCALEQRQLRLAQSWVESGLVNFPRDPELLFRAGVIYHESRELQKAEEAYIQLLTRREVGHIDSLDITMTGFKAHHNLAVVYRDMGRMPEAEAHFRRALDIEPRFEPSLAGLAEIHGRPGIAAGSEQIDLAFVPSRDARITAHA